MSTDVRMHTHGIFSHLHALDAHLMVLASVCPGGAKASSVLSAPPPQQVLQSHLIIVPTSHEDLDPQLSKDSVRAAQPPLTEAGAAS